MLPRKNPGDSGKRNIAMQHEYCGALLSTGILCFSIHLGRLDENGTRPQKRIIFHVLSICFRLDPLEQKSYLLIKRQIRKSLVMAVHHNLMIFLWYMTFMFISLS